MSRTARAFTAPVLTARGNELIVDLKRLNDYEIDEKHFYAVVGSAWSTLLFRKRP